MIHRRKAALIFVLVLVVGPVGGARAEGLLFVGNSYTYQNGDVGLAACTANIIEELTGVAPAYTVVAKGGWTFAKHLADAGTGGEQLSDLLGLGATSWDAVVLQEQSQIPGFWSVDGSPFPESLDAAVGLDALAEDAQARTVFLMTWGRRDGDSTNPAIFPDFLTMQELLVEGYEQYAAAASVTLPPAKIAPVGLAWRQTWEDAAAAGQDPLDPAGIFWRLYAGDGSHPSVLGSYLAGLVLAATLTGQDPTASTWKPTEVDPEDAAVLRDLARRVVLGDVPVPGTWPVPETIEVLHEGQVMELELEDYVKGVLPPEIGTNDPLETARAQAVAVRTYALRYVDLHGPICTTSQCQVWTPAHDPFTDQAVDSTAGVVALYDQALAPTYYFHACGGRTLSSEEVWGDPQAPLVPVDCMGNKVGLCEEICDPGVPDPAQCWEPNGHRVGLCQRGAAAMGACGASFQEILAHYYTGIELANLPSQPAVEPGPEVVEASSEPTWEARWEVWSEEVVTWELIAPDTPGLDRGPGRTADTPGSEDTPDQGGGAGRVGCTTGAAGSGPLTLMLLLVLVGILGRSRRPSL